MKRIISIATLLIVGITSSVIFSSKEPKMSYEEVKGQILPQIIPPRIPDIEALVSAPLAGDLRVGFVIDDEISYRYLDRETVKEWNISGEDLWQNAIRNLMRISQGMEVRRFSKSDTPFIAVGVCDSYDAARILMPEFKTKVTRELGSPFNFGIPNREFLICWPASADKEIQDFAVKQVAADFKAHQYPISPKVFQVSEDGTITLPNQPMEATK
jgi:uncharacterized protein YtpQ (UPF0354 family)